MNGIFDPHIHIKTITIVGLGGTGSQVARIVGRILYAMRRNRQHTPQMVLIDPDKVEAANVGRQLFTPADVGHYKAEIVGRRLNLALGLDTRWILEAVDAERHFERYASSLIVSCVDQHQARCELHRVEGVLIGAGNHADSGQVCIGNSADLDLVRQYLRRDDDRYPYLPKEGLLFPQLLESEVQDATQPEIDARSCAELVASGTQHLLINDWMACVAGQYVYRLLHRQPITTFLTYLSVDDLVVQSKPIRPEEIVAYLNRPEVVEVSVG